MEGRDDAVARFDALFERCRGVVFSWLLGQTGDREAAKDLLQSTFMKVWRSIGSVPGEDADRWILAIARNTLIDHRRRQTVRTNLLGTLPAVEPPSREPTPEQEVSARETLDHLDRAIRELPEDQRTVLTLSVFENMTSDEIGRLLGRPSGTVRYQLGEARSRLARRLNIQ